MPRRLPEDRGAPQRGEARPRDYACDVCGRSPARRDPSRDRQLCLTCAGLIESLRPSPLFEVLPMCGSSIEVVTLVDRDPLSLDSPTLAYSDVCVRETVLVVSWASSPGQPYIRVAYAPRADRYFVDAPVPAWFEGQQEGIAESLRRSAQRYGLDEGIPSTTHHESPTSGPWVRGRLPLRIEEFAFLTGPLLALDD